MPFGRCLFLLDPVSSEDKTPKEKEDVKQDLKSEEKQKE